MKAAIDKKTTPAPGCIDAAWCLLECTPCWEQYEASQKEKPKLKTKVIYIAGQYSGKTINDTFENIIRARRAAYRLWNQGYACICPHTNSMFMDGEDIDATREMFIRGDLEILSRCDAIYMLKNWRASRGAIMEHTEAQLLGLEIIYED